MRVPLVLILACILLSKAAAATPNVNSNRRRLSQIVENRMSDPFAQVRAVRQGQFAGNCNFKSKQDVCLQEFTQETLDGRFTASDIANAYEINIYILQCLNRDLDVLDSESLVGKTLNVPCDSAVSEYLRAAFGSNGPAGQPQPAPSPEPSPEPEQLNFGSGAVPAQQNWVDAHNRLRALHQNTGSVVWDDTVASVAEAWARNCPTISNAHNENRYRILPNGRRDTLKYGENVAFGAIPADSETDIDSVVKDWYSEIQYWDTCNGQSRNTRRATGHFTQVVWKATTKIGCAVNEECPDVGYGPKVFVCNYDPPGNFNSDYKRQVAPLKTDSC